MCKLLLIAFLGMVTFLMPGCGKDDPPPLPEEEQLKISTDAQSYSEIPSSSTGFNLTIESAMPPGGVKIQALVIGETDNITYFTGSVIETSAKTTTLTISNLPRQKICICTVTVISKSRTGNSVLTLFRIVYK